jgi:hypothetical protein
MASGLCSLSKFVTSLFALLMGIKPELLAPFSINIRLAQEFGFTLQIILNIMKYSTIISAIIGSASAIVLPRQACLPLKHSVAPGPVPNTVESFGNYPFYSEIAKVVVSPAGFEPIAKAASAAVNSAGHMHIINLDSYDVSACAQHCDTTGGCEACELFIKLPYVSS